MIPRYPGLGLPLRHEFEEDDAYVSGPHNMGNSGSRMISVREVAMMHIMDRFTDKENWRKMIFDEDLVLLWRQEMQAIPDEEIKNIVYTGKYDDLINNELVFDPVECLDGIEPPWHIRLTGIINDAVLDFCVQELRIKARYFEKSGIVPTLDSYISVAKSDHQVSEELHDALYSVFRKLGVDENTPDQNASPEEIVKDLIDPSMYPLVYGRTRGFQEECVGFSNAVDHWSGKGTVLRKRGRYPETDPWKELDYWSTCYQWLPANLEFEEDDSLCFTSYINNLHPVKYYDTYAVIEKLITKSIPLWDQCLGSGRHEARFLPPKEPEDENEKHWFPSKAECADVLVPEEKLKMMMNEYRDLNDEIIGDLEEGHGYNVGRAHPREEESDAPYHPDFITHCKWMIVRKCNIPEPQFTERDNLDYTPVVGRRLVDRFRESGLQVIVKMTSIELTPENPEYSTEEWQFAGQSNEHICATAIYCLDSENLTNTALSFRTQTDEENPDFLTSSDDGFDFYIGQRLGEDWLQQIYGTRLYSGECIQSYGNVEIPTGRLIAFPNSFQTRFSPTKLIDATKPGYRRYIVVHLVEPSSRILSTANIPPQQMHWFSDSLIGSTPTRKEARSKFPAELLVMLSDKKEDAIQASADSRLPVELMDMVFEHFRAKSEQLPMVLEEAKEHRAKLVEERKKFHEKVNMDWNEKQYQCVEE